MIISFIILFWLATFILVYHYALYPLLISRLSRGKSNNPIVYNTLELPKISILLAAYNEESVIEEKILSTFRTDYPLDKIEFLIGSDASTDATDDTIKKYTKKYPELKLIRFGGRTGKPQIINELEKEATGKILVLTDANVFFGNSCLTELVKHFKNDNIGLVGGNILNLETKNDGISNQEKAYLGQENKLKYNEGVLWGSMMGAFGGVYAVRKSLYTVVPKGYLVDDFYISMSILKKGYHAINSLESIAYEDVSNIPKEEFKRKVRIGIGNFQNLFTFKSLLWCRFGVSFSFISHKVLRWKGPFFLILMVISTFMLREINLYKISGLALFLFLLSPIWDVVCKKIGVHYKILRFTSHFVMMNLALLIGFFKFVTGNYGTTWTPTKRNQ